MEPLEQITVAQIWAALEDVKDPEIPVVSVVGMGIVTEVTLPAADTCIVSMTPTFVGCPAIEVMRKGISDRIKQMGIEKVTVHVNLKKHWTSDRMTATTKKNLEQFGLAPPPVIGKREFTDEVLDEVRCPHCGNTETILKTPFGSTLCRAIRYCPKCKTTFEQFKPVQ